MSFLMGLMGLADASPNLFIIQSQPRRHGLASFHQVNVLLVLVQRVPFGSLVRQDVVHQRVHHPLNLATGFLVHLIQIHHFDYLSLISLYLLYHMPANLSILFYVKYMLTYGPGQLVLTN